MSTERTDSVRTYVTIYVILLVLMGLTIAVWPLDIGVYGTLLAMAIATTKAVLVVLVFMHVRHASKLTWLFACAAFIWLAIMIGLTFNDYYTRESTINFVQLERITESAERAQLPQQNVRPPTD